MSFQMVSLDHSDFDCMNNKNKDNAFFKIMSFVFHIMRVILGELFLQALRMNIRLTVKGLSCHLYIYIYIERDILGVPVGLK